MKIYLLPAVCLLLIFGSCKKQSPNAPVETVNNTITADIDGSNVTFNTNATARLIPGGVPGYPYALEIMGKTDTSSSRQLIEFDLNSLNPFTTGTMQSAVDINPPIFLDIVYAQYTPGSKFPADYITDPNVAGSSTVTITSISNARIQGTFSGALPSSTNGQPGKNVTNGKFNLVLFTN